MWFLARLYNAQQMRQCHEWAGLWRSAWDLHFGMSMSYRQHYGNLALRQTCITKNMQCATAQGKQERDAW